MATRPGTCSAQGLENVAAYHTLSSAVGKVAAQAGAGILLLNHFVPVDFDRTALLAEIRADFTGPILIGEDLLTLDVPSRVVIHQELHLGLEARVLAPPSASSLASRGTKRLSQG
jgi:ribonuclease Z